MTYAQLHYNNFKGPLQIEIKILYFNEYFKKNMSKI